jgi:hypothetical protein
MAKENKPAANLDDELNTWLGTTDGDTREVIVEISVPQRRVWLATGTGQRMRPDEVTTVDSPSRTAVLKEVQDFLTGVLGTAPRINQAAGAIPLLVNRDQLRKIMSHPLVRVVRANRRLN